MRWKSSLAIEEQHQEMQDWIANTVLEKEEEISKPWKADEGEDGQSMENEYIQRYTLPTSDAGTPN